MDVESLSGMRYLSFVIVMDKAAMAVLMFPGSVNQSTAASTMRGSDLALLPHKRDVCPQYGREEVLGVDLQSSSDLS